MVDDGSEQPAQSVLEGLPVHCLRHPVNLGQGAALQTGTAYSVSRGAEIVVHFDADGQHPAERIPALIEPIVKGECDVALGSRFLDPSHRAQVPWRKRLVLKIGVAVSGLLTGVWLTDTHNGFRALSRRAAEQIELRENGFAHATEILEQIRFHGLRRREIPSLVRYTEYSLRKGQRISNSVNIIMDLLLRKVLK